VLHQVAFEAGTVLVVPPPELCTDNGAMIAWAGAERLALGLTVTLAAVPHARWPLAEVTKPAHALPVTSDVTILDIIATGLPKIAPAKDG
jgi:N6-L-threonylcarbamoyladenine synthase